MATEMNKPIEAVIRRGKIEPVEPLDLPDETRVAVTITHAQLIEAAEKEPAKSYHILQQAGLIEKVPDPNTVPSWKLHPSIAIPGEPLSEIIIRMRDPEAQW
jgi:hypothetical protein